MVRLFLSGDVMTGRGVDQMLRRPSDPRLQESYIRDARDYLRLAEQASGPVPYPVDGGYLWGDVLPLLDRLVPDLRVLNLETSITRSDDFAPGKPVHYRMHPANLDCLAMVRPLCVLGNNHVLDYGPAGLVETCDTLDAAGIVTAGAGRDEAAARRPAVADLNARGRVLVFSFGTESAGVPPSWAAGPDRPGVDFLPDLSAVTADRVAERIDRVRRPGDIVLASVHWGSNWGYDVPRPQRSFAHRLVDAGVDLVHGHSSHHPRPLEVHRGRLILYGCGDLIDDYEGITGHEAFRPELRLAYLAELRPGDGELERLTLWPMRIRRIRLHHTDPDETGWLSRTLNRIYAPFGAAVQATAGGALRLL